VIISVPEASKASSIVSALSYLPVPRIKRDRKVRSAMVRGCTSVAGLLGVTVVIAVILSAGGSDVGPR
jgi:hypothetical protein